MGKTDRQVNQTWHDRLELILQRRFKCKSKKRKKNLRIVNRKIFAILGQEIGFQVRCQNELIKKGIFGLCQMRKLIRFRFKAVALETTASYSSVFERANWKRKGKATNISSVKLHRADQKVLESMNCYAKFQLWEACKNVWWGKCSVPWPRLWMHNSSIFKSHS